MFTRSIIKVSVIIAAASLLSSTAQATTYYVRKSGNNSRNGLTPATAWLTIDKAADVMDAGDVTYVGAGTYNETVTPIENGTSGSPIRYYADTTGSHTGDAGSVIVHKTGSSGHALDVEDDNYQQFFGFKFSGGGDTVNWDDSIGGLLENCEIYGGDVDGVHMQSDATLTLTNCVIRDNGDDGVDPEGGDHTCTITGCVIRDNGEDGIDVDGWDSTITVRQSQIYDNSQHGIFIYGGGGTIVNCLIHSNGGCGIKITDTDSSLNIWHCTIARNGSDGVRIDGTATIKNCIVAFNDDDGLDKEGGSLTHTHNCVHGNDDDNFDSLSSSTGEITSNPNFISSSDYRLASGSPAANTGTSGSSMTSIDIDGATRPGGAGWDMGCYESEGASFLTDVSSTLNINVTTTTSELAASGWHWADLDGDGDMDGIVTGTSGRVLINNGGTSFTVVSLGDVRGQGAIGDFDCDGDVDFWSARLATSDSEGFFANNGSGTLTSTGTAGLSACTNNEGVAAIDFNWDGWLDLVMFSESGNYRCQNQASSSLGFTPSTHSSFGFNDSGDYGNGDFISSGDVNNDGYLDFFHHFGSGKLYLSAGNGRWIETDAGISISTGTSTPIGSAWADYDDDGDLDLFVPRYSSGSAGSLWRNTGSTFANVASSAGLTDPSGQRSAAWGDVDNDGDQDLYIVTRSGNHVLYLNNDNGTFTATGGAATGNGQDAALVDFDNDGDLDISVSRTNETAVMLQNSTNSTGYLKVRPIGFGAGATNRTATGVRVDLYATNGTTFLARRDIALARGYGGTGPTVAHFGGLTNTATYVVKVHFQTGIVSVTVVPQSASSVVGGHALAQTLTVAEPEPPARQVLHWTEVDPVDR